MRHPPAARLSLSAAAFAILALAGAAALWSPSAVVAQSQVVGPAMTPEEIAVCLCQKQSLDQQQSSVDVESGLLQERQQELANLDAEIKRQATGLSSTDSVGQQVLQDLIAQQIQLRNLIQLQIRPAYNQKLNTLRDSIEGYTAQCTGRPRYVLDVERAQQNLSCPAQ